MNNTANISTDSMHRGNIWALPWKEDAASLFFPMTRTRGEMSRGGKRGNTGSGLGIARKNVKNMYI